jgi:death-on-curing protein
LKLLTEEQVLRIHRDSMRRYGGTPGIISRSILGACLSAPFEDYFGLQPYNTLWAKASALLHCIICRHPFVDGNKRTGWVATKLFLRFNGYSLKVETNEAEEMTLRVARGEMGIEDISSWLESHVASV